MAVEIDRTLKASLCLVIVRKVSASGKPELAVAAIVDGDPPYVLLNRKVIMAVPVSPSDSVLSRPGKRTGLYAAAGRPVFTPSAIIVESFLNSAARR